MSTLVFVEDAHDELSQQALTFARTVDPDVIAIRIGDGGTPYAPAAWAQALVEAINTRSPQAVIGPGTDRGNEVLGHVAAKLDLPMAANCTSVTPGSPATATRVRWGGSLLEQASLNATPLLATVAAHAVTADPAAADLQPEVLQPNLDGPDAVVKVSERVQAASAGISLTDAPVVVSGGRGVGSSEGFAALEELAALLHGAVGCSRAVTSAGWRPHTDQVGQTGSKVSPEIYIACGISGATQHMAGCKGAKKLLAINPDGEASIFANADYAVIGDLHEVVPAISQEIKKARGT